MSYHAMSPERQPNTTRAPPHSRASPLFTMFLNVGRAHIILGRATIATLFIEHSTQIRGTIAQFYSYNIFSLPFVILTIRIKSCNKLIFLSND